MPINDESLKREELTLGQLGLRYNGLSWCELGNIHIFGAGIAKQYYESLGVKHTSIDINGEDGALCFDLCEPLPKLFFNKFDVVTNYGTGEHVANQDQLFKNIHNITKQGGIMIHNVPQEGCWANHCLHYYTEEFFVKLAKKYQYEIMELYVLNPDTLKSLIRAVLKKRK